MVRRYLALSLPLLWVAGGCITQETTTPLVPAGPFGHSPTAVPSAKAAYSPATAEAATRVARLGQQVLAANGQLGVRPSFMTVGLPQPAIFHRGSDEIAISEGLVKQCATDNQLAAVLCLELGRMVSEREALAGPQGRKPEYEPPIDSRVGNDGVGAGNTADLTRRGELAKYDQERRRPTLPPDPQLLARSYLMKAGYPAEELDAVAPLLRSATNTAMEKQLTAGPAERAWTP